MSSKDQAKWDKKYSATDHVPASEPSEWLESHAFLLPGTGKALDIAAGEGRNTVFSALLGYDAYAVDVSQAGLDKAKLLANEKKAKISAIYADLDEYRPEPNEYDLILCFNFLDRKLFPAIQTALKPGGLLFYETFSSDHLKYTSFKREWVLEPNELLKVFHDLRVLRYREVDDTEAQKGFASLIAQKPIA
ncbi:MAG: methyltransferase domain-containing protein [Candidatus Nitrohelix vancouverensis]|uniref:Methyltransferase domain-containing protein n=1 Tax=Candidatus Nitrohelix vancouverensis TaxID=2705534 RepID=A0A7T0BZM6_9BACT|nr:MAG: methyltransferase domain-containing protein [Candidatus Nitrohelix vancouverensis]